MTMVGRENLQMKAFPHEQVLERATQFLVSVAYNY